MQAIKLNWVMENELKKILLKKSLTIFDQNSLDEASRGLTKNYADKAGPLFGNLSGKLVDSVPPDIRFLLTSHIGIDAFAGPLPGTGNFLVGVGYGVVANLYACFSGLLSHPKVLSYIGDSANTHCKYDKVDDGLIDFTYENNTVRQHTSVAEGFPLWNYPKDEDRILYVQLLCDIAVQFVLFHEWGHILDGHVSYLKSVYGVNELAEMEVSADLGLIEETLLDEPIRKSMEFNADYVASCMAARMPMDLQLTGRTIFNHYPSAFIARYDTRDAVFFSLLCLFHLFHELRIKKGLVNTNQYPSPYLRFTSLFAGMYSNPQADTADIWEGYEFQAGKDFAEVSQLLEFELLFGNEMFDQKALGKSINKLLDQITALSIHLRDYRLS